MPHLVGWGFVGPATLVVVGLAIFPAVWALWLSFHDSDLISSGEFVGLANYREMVHDPALRDAAWHTVVYTVLYVPGSVLLGLPLAVALNQRIRGIGIYRTCIFVPYVTSAAAVGILSNFVLDPEFGIVNGGVQALGLPGAGFLRTPARRCTRWWRCRCGGRSGCRWWCTSPRCRTSRASCGRRRWWTARPPGRRSGT